MKNKKGDIDSKPNAQLMFFLLGVLVGGYSVMIIVKIFLL